MKNSSLILIMLILGMVSLVIGTAYFWIGIHNVDLTFNMVTILGEDALDSHGDTTNFGFVTYRELYISGMLQLKWSLLIILLGGLCMGVIMGKWDKA